MLQCMNKGEGLIGIFFLQQGRKNADLMPCVMA